MIGCRGDLMGAGVRRLETLWAEGSPHYGSKANNLSLMMAWGVPILPGFCVTFDIKRGYEEQMLEFSSQIEEAFRRLMHDANACSVIVRSSADMEDAENAFFPGIFQSLSQVRELSELYSAIRCCYNSVNLPHVRYYAKANGISCKFKYFTVLVQIQLKSEVAGVASTQFPLPSYQRDGVMLTQLTKGDNHKLVKGLGSSNTYSFYKQGETVSYHQIAGEIDLEKDTETRVLSRLYEMLCFLREKFQRELDVEWGYGSDVLYIFQARFLKKSSRESHRGREITALTNDAEQGFKYQSMHFFQLHGLFQREVFFFPKQTPKEEIAAVLQSCPQKGPFTVRYSRGREIGLPRYFASDSSSASQFVLKTKEADWSVIAYRSLSVEHSYELYIDHEKLILEHVPGMWESDSNLIADTIVVTGDQIDLWLAGEERTAKYEDDSGKSTCQVPPLSVDCALAMLEARIPALDKLRELFDQDLPLNFHFVSDTKGDYFLNCRLTPLINWNYQCKGEAYIIREFSDCSGWDGVSSILFQPNLHRGEEIFLSKFIPFLKSVSVPILVEFGILSHPAIMLRELGITVMPQFLQHNYFSASKSDIKTIRREQVCEGAQT